MKICIVISTLLSGGAERNACMLAEYLVKNNDVKILTFQKSKKSFYNISKKITIRGLDLLQETNFFFFKILNLFKRIYVIRKNLIKEKPDIIISFLETTNITVLASSLFLNGIKLRIISDRNNPRYTENKLLIFLLKIIFYRLADFLVLQTTKIRENYKFVNRNKIRIIPNIISRIKNIKKKVILKKKLKILSVGRLEAQKGYDILFKALSLLKNDKVSFICNVYGAGSEKNKLLSEIKKKKLSTNVKLKGVNKNIINIYKNYDLYILSSKFEGFPNSLIEALSAGLACISSNCRYGPSEIIKIKKNGLLFENNNYLDLHQKIKYLLKNKNYFVIFNRNARKDYNYEKFNKDKFLKWKKIIKTE